MGRRLSWLDRLYPISRTVAGSARSHYDRKDLQQLFEIQPRSAQNLMAALPTVPIGRARLVDRETLNNFLEQLQQADDPAQAFAEIGKGREGPSGESCAPSYSKTCKRTSIHCRRPFSLAPASCTSLSRP